MTRYYCVHKRCRNKPATGMWLCNRCAKFYGRNCRVGGKYVPFYGEYIRA
jgi:hypothetical protein